jgi:hypothetical protein
VEQKLLVQALERSFNALDSSLFVDKTVAVEFYGLTADIVTRQNSMPEIACPAARHLHCVAQQESRIRYGVPNRNVHFFQVLIAKVRSEASLAATSGVSEFHVVGFAGFLQDLSFIAARST